MKMKSISSMLLVLALVCEGGGPAPEDGYVPDEGFVPNKDVAIKIAVAVWEPIYGAEKIAQEKPYRATLADGVWTVEGSLPRGMKGGVALAKISKEDGRILRVTHGK
jgi:hypothetical protein